MIRLLWDCETNGLLDVVHTIHCIAVVNLDTKEEWFYGPDEIDEGLKRLDTADELWAHNGQSYDLVVAKRLKGWEPRPGVVIRDSLVISRLKYPDRANDDLKDSRESVQRLNGSHSLEAWGVRLGCPKIEFEGPWEAYTEVMGKYCRGDIKTNVKLVEHLAKIPCPEEAIELEHAFALIADQIHERGFSFDSDGAVQLCAEIEEKSKQIEQEFKKYAPDTILEMKKAANWIVTWPDGSKEEFPTKGEADRVRKERKIKPRECSLEPGPKAQKVVPFNLNSRHQVRKYLLDRHAWISPELSDKGQELLEDGGDFKTLAEEYGSISEDVLRTLDFPEASLLADFQMLQKRLGQIRDGENGWLRLVRTDGRIHGRIIPIGCATMRCAHMAPNLAQVPHVLVDKEKGILWGLEGRYGAECRGLFRAADGYVQIGTDLGQIESRMLAVFLHQYDGGEYAALVNGGDLHSFNADAVLKYAHYKMTRNDTKTPYYASMYGAGAEKIGKTVVSTTEDAKKEFKEVFEAVSRGVSQGTKYASLVRWGHETPEDPSDRRFQKLRWAVEGCKDAQKATWIANSVVGSRVLYAFRKGTKGLDTLIEAVQKAGERGYITPLDGRRIPIRSAHAALNSLLQGSAAIVMKRWVVGTVEECRAKRLDAHLLACVHDELQAEVRPEHAEAYKEVCLGNIRKAGEHYRFPLPLVGEAKQGAHWRDCH